VSAVGSPERAAAREAPAPAPFGHLPVLDGLRTLAVVPVVLFHAWEPTFPGGFIGVDLFFVISGFLITSILVRERDVSGRVDLRAFWGRRVRRLVPAVAVVVAVSAIVTVLVGQGSLLAFVDSVGALTWSQNWLHLWASRTSWGLASAPTAIDHLWSLAVEEQFYLVWPLVLLAITSLASRRTARIVLVVVLVAASATAMAAVDPVAAYFRSDARAFELLGGAVLALSGWRPRRIAASLLGAVGVAAIVGFTFIGSPTDAWMYPWGFLVATAAFAGLVAAAASPPAWMSAVFAAPVQAVGRVSYGIYLWHLPVIRFVTARRTHLPEVPLAVVRLTLVAALVVASYRLVEHPVRSRRWPLTPLRVGVAGAVVVACLVPLGVSGRRDWDHRFDVAGRPPASPAGATRVLVVGDGVAGVAARAFPIDSAWDVSRWQCGILPGDVRRGGAVVDLDDSCDHWRERWTDALERFHPDVVVVASATWDLLPRADGSSVVTGADRRTYQAAADLLGSTGARVVWFEPAPNDELRALVAGEGPTGFDALTRRASTLRSVVDGLDGVEAVSAVPTHSAPGPGFTDGDLLAAAARLATEVGR
jgi:peptidoglycan/LPS O-acetylase OafA/YrhL